MAANSGTVGPTDLVIYTQYNNLRKDCLDATSGHTHSGSTDGGKLIPQLDTCSFVEDGLNKETNYLNDTGHMLFLNTIGLLSDGDGFGVYVCASSPATAGVLVTYIGNFTGTAPMYMTASAIIPNGSYYYIYEEGTASFETRRWTLHA